MARRTRVGPPPHFINRDTYNYLSDLGNAINALPEASLVSTSSGPNSSITADPGTLGLDIGSSATTFWMKESGSTTTGWSSIASHGYIDGAISNLSSRISSDISSLYSYIDTTASALSSRISSDVSSLYSYIDTALIGISPNYPCVAYDQGRIQTMTSAGTELTFGAFHGPTSAVSPSGFPYDKFHLLSDGTYTLLLNSAYTESAAGFDLTYEFTHNGSTTSFITRHPAAAATPTHVNLFGVVDATSGDTVTVRVTRSTAGSSTLYGLSRQFIITRY